jgi:hypothetical protein
LEPGERIPEIPEDIRETALDLYGRWDGEGLRRTGAFLEMVAHALLAERERCAKIAEAEKVKAIGIYPPGEQRGIAIAVADYIKDAIRA